MSFTIINAEQRSPEWFACRAGRLTGSSAGDMLAQIKSGEAAARRDLRMRLVVERLTGLPQEDGFISKDMQRGIDLEPAAFAAYEALTGHLADRTGFVAHDELLAGCSLDGHVHAVDHGILELKCPKSTTHIKYIQGRRLPPEHKAQITHNLWITGAQWCDFVSFDDRFPPALQVFYIRVERKDVDVTAYELAARLFLDEVDQELETVRGLASVAA
jgi:hypothetical protein